jgi:hypothetical protein
MALDDPGGQIAGWSQCVTSLSTHPNEDLAPEANAGLCAGRRSGPKTGGGSWTMRTGPALSGAAGELAILPVQAMRAGRMRRASWN